MRYLWAGFAMILAVGGTALPAEAHHRSYYDPYCRGPAVVVPPPRYYAPRPIIVHPPPYRYYALPPGHAKRLYFYAPQRPHYYRPHYQGRGA